MPVGVAYFVYLSEKFKNLTDVTIYIQPVKDLTFTAYITAWSNSRENVYWISPNHVEGMYCGGRFECK